MEKKELLSVVLFIRTFLLAYFPILDVLLFRTPADRGHLGSSLRAANSEQTAFSKERITVLHGMQQMTPQQLRTGHKGPGQNLALKFARHEGEAAAWALAEKWLAAERKDPQGASALLKIRRGDD